MKLGVVYCKAGQKTAPEMFANLQRDCSLGFWEFMEVLAQQIDLEGWTKYRGDMRSLLSFYDCFNP